MSRFFSRLLLERLAFCWIFGGEFLAEFLETILLNTLIFEIQTPPAA